MFEQQWKWAGAALIAASFGAMPLWAANRQPAEQPPSSFTSPQYVDSKGCIFIRAGSGGAVTWIPRMNRGREQVCGASPSLAGRSTTTASAATVRTPTANTNYGTSATEVRMLPPRITYRPETTPSPQNAAPQVAPQVIVTNGNRSPAGSGVILTGGQQQQRYVTSAPAPTTRYGATAPVRVASGGQGPVGGCGASAISSQYMNPTRRADVRCGPQAVHPADAWRAGGAGRMAVSGSARGSTYGAPFEAVNANPNVPQGYRAAWDDGRLNPNRGPQGYGASSGGDRVLMWTSTAPFRLIDVSTGQDVTAQYPQIAPPSSVRGAGGRYASGWGQTGLSNSYTSTMSSRGAVAQSESRARVTAASVGQSGAGAGRAVSRSIAGQPDPRGVPVAVGVGHRFVQVGAYTNPARAQQALQVLSGLGLPVARSMATRDGQAAQKVLAGPFNSAQALGEALYRARQAGFSGAITQR